MCKHSVHDGNQSPQGFMSVCCRLYPDWTTRTELGPYEVGNLHIWGTVAVSYEVGTLS